MADQLGSRPRRLPVVIAGERLDRSSGGDLDFDTPTGVRYVLPQLGPAEADRLLAQDRQLLADVPLQDILTFLNRAGKNWKNAEYVRRRLYVRQLHELLGYSEKAADAEADRIAILLTSHARMYDMVEAELGSRFILDDWVRREESQVR